MSDDRQLVTVLKTTDLGLLTVVRSLLDAGGVAYEIQGGEALHLLPIPTDGLLKSGSLAASLRVAPADAPLVHELLARAERDRRSEADET